MPVFSPEELRRHAQVALMDTADRTAVPASPKPTSHVPMHASVAVMGVGQLTDALSTVSALKRGAQESNIGVYGKSPSTTRLLATKAATMVPTAIMLEKLYTHHPKLAEALALGIGGAGFGTAMHNARQGHKE